MKTENFIELLVNDSRPPWRFRFVLAAALSGGILVAAVIFFAAIGFRPDISVAIRSVRFLFKFVVTVTLAATATVVVVGISRPGAPLPYRGLVVALAPILLLSAAIVELAVVPGDEWMPRMIGSNARFCLTFIPLLSVGPLAGILAALRFGAPSHPGGAGALAGLAASGIAATFYAANCNDDSPLFVLMWYPIAITSVTVMGYLMGRRMLRW